MKKDLTDNNIIAVIILNLYLILCFQDANSFENKILFKVDQELITSVDIYNQSKYLVALNEDMENIGEEKIFEISKNFLIKEKIKKIALRKENIDIEINDEILDSFIKSNFPLKNIDNFEKFKKFINSLAIDVDPFKEKLIIEILWNNLIFQKFYSKIKINKDDLKNEILNEKNKFLSSYLLHEIVFNASNKSELDEKYKLIQTSINEVGFKKTAFLYSNSDSASNGGYLGWINENALNKQILKYIQKLDIGENSEPILIPGGFLILKIQDQKEEERKIDLEKELNELIKSRTNQQLIEYSNMFFNKSKKNVIIVYE